MPSEVVYNVKTKGALDDEHDSLKHLSLTQKQKKSHEKQLLSSWPTTRRNIENQKQDYKKEQEEHHQVEAKKLKPHRLLTNKNAQDKPSSSTQEEHNSNDVQILKRTGDIYNHIEGRSKSGAGDYYSNIEYLRENSNPSIFRGNIPNPNNTNLRGYTSRQVLNSVVDTNMLRMMSPAGPGGSVLSPPMPSLEAYAAFLLERSHRDQEIAKLIMSSSSYNHQSPFSISPSDTLPSRWNHTSPYHDESSIDPDAAHSSTPATAAGSTASYLASASIYSQGDNQLPLLPTTTTTGSSNEHPQLSLLPSRNSLSDCTVHHDEGVSAKKRKLAHLKKDFNITSTAVTEKGKGREGTASTPASDSSPEESSSVTVNPDTHPRRVHDDATSKRVGELEADRVAAASKTDTYRPFHYDPLSMNKLDEQREVREHEHFSTRPYMSLSVPEDQERLSPFLCFFRKEYIEVFEATNASIAIQRKCNKVLLHQIGIRCRFCAHVQDCRLRAKRSSCFPSSTCRIYQALNVMLFVHFPHCQEIPSDERAKFDRLKNLKCCASVRKAPKIYWKNTAESLGMINAETGGMFMINRLSSISPCPSVSTICTDTKISATPIAPSPGVMAFDITSNSPNYDC